jgi:hypothetical protein
MVRPAGDVLPDWGKAYPHGIVGPDGRGMARMIGQARL